MTSSKIPAMAKRIELWPVEKLVPYERNARTHSQAQISQIAGSIVEFGFLNPILVDTSAGILAGHGRLSAAKQLGLAKVPVVVLDHLSEEQRRAYVLADNKLAENAGWDLELLRQEINAMEIDPGVLGFGEDDLKRLHDGLELEAFEGLAAGPGTERAEPEHQPGLGLPESDDEDDAADATAESGEVEERHIFSVNLLWDDREVLLAAVRAAKERWSLEGTPEALVAICREWLDEQDAGTD